MNAKNKLYEVDEPLLDFSNMNEISSFSMKL